MSKKPSMRVARRALLVIGTAVLTMLGAGAVSASAAGAPAAAPHVANCATSQLTVWMAVPGNGAAGTTYYEVEFSNVSGSTCQLFGFPGVSGLSGGQQVGAAATWDHGVPSSSVVLTPGATAHTVLGVVNVDNYPAPACNPTPTDSLRIYPPNQTAAVVISFPLRGCQLTQSPYLIVRPITAGVGVPGQN